MNRQEIEKAFPVGSRVQLWTKEIGEVLSYVEHLSERRHYLRVWLEDRKYELGTWPEYATLLRPLSPLELDIQAYIDEEMRLLHA